MPHGACADREPQRPGVQAELTQATGTAEREAAPAMVGALEGDHRLAVGANQAYDMLDFVAEMRNLSVPHTLRRTRRTGVPPPTAAPRGTLAMRPANANASGSKRCSAG